MDEISRQILINQRTIMSAIDEMQTFMVNLPASTSLHISEDLQVNIRATKQILDNHQKG
ncbi:MULTISPECIES: hypothetical protein [unclassified Coprococcus]|uniref:hypothetical protein n=1 Tax=unclassified Coprococcus TaxID=2684943 RepID=UPI001314423D|nr:MULTISPECIES: hypothetical protein [unclassified Coprococcus]